MRPPYGRRNWFETVRHDPFITPTIAAATATGLSTGAALAPAAAVAGPIASLAVPGSLAIPGLAAVGGVSGLVKGALTVGSIASGVMDKVTNANAADAEAARLRAQAKAAERQQLNKDSAVLGKQNAIATASGLDKSGGSLLAVMNDSIRSLEMNAANVRRTGQIQADQRQAEAGAYTRQIPGAIIDPLMQKNSLLSQWMTNRGYT